MRLRTEHFERARSVVRRWREDGFDTVVVVRRQTRAGHCYPCRRQDVPERAVPSWDFYPIPSAQSLGETPPDRAHRVEGRAVGGCDNRLRIRVPNGRGRRQVNYCPGCALELRRLQLWCSCCRRLTVNWLHVFIVAALDAAGVIGLLGYGGRLCLS